MGITQNVAAWAATARYDDLPAEVVGLAKNGILDTVGVTLAGVEEQAARITRQIIEEDGARPIAGLVGHQLRTSPESAAFLNGTAGHALDYDDVSMAMQGHPSVVVLPAVLAAAEQAGGSGRDAILGYAVGVEVMSKLGEAMGQGHYELGWHATCTLGTIAAAAAAGRVLGLDAGQMANALAIAVSEAGALQENFGTMVKPFHAGHGARSGVHAARLARAGFVGNPAIMEAPRGYFARYSTGDGHQEAMNRLGQPWGLQAPGLNVKKYPCCFCTHRAADAILDMNIDADQLEQVVVHAPKGDFGPLIHTRPTTGLQGKFSMEYVVAAALLDRRLVLNTFEDRRVQRPEAQRLLQKVQRAPLVGVAGADHPNSAYVEVEARLKDGSKRIAKVEAARGGPDSPLTEAELDAKFLDCASRVLDTGQARELIAILRNLDNVPRAADVVQASLAKVLA
ncbi:MAG TPA: MmgE/PrpD family protein [Chloroflexota bacterium]|nr:MmgE/PrpD family protein [Chloroflexota bacterium]